MERPKELGVLIQTTRGVAIAFVTIGASDAVSEPILPPPKFSKLAKSLVSQNNSAFDILRAETALLKPDMECIQHFKEIKASFNDYWKNSKKNLGDKKVVT